MVSIAVTTPPAEEPVTLAEAKAHLRIDHSTEDSLITALITACRLNAEKYTNRAFCTQTIRYAVDGPPMVDDQGWADYYNDRPWRKFERVIELPRPPLISVTSIVAFDADGTSEEVALDETVFIDTKSEPGRVALRLFSVWPGWAKPLDSLVFTYQAGYGDAAAVPEDIKLAIKVAVAAHYEDRGDGQQKIDPQSGLPPLAAMLLQSYRIIYLA